LGTALHGHAWFPNGADSAIPYGAALALLLVASVGLFVGLWGKSSWSTVWCGAAAYMMAGLLSLRLGSFGLIFDNLQGRVWLYGIALVTPLAAGAVWAILRAQRKLPPPAA
jgi:N-acetyl-1-D-myo-inositol-2-amino-2-deoxy-alpha-D-glucopyranoside deacetylase